MQDFGINEIKKVTQVARERYGYDFSNYAISSFKRRLERIIEIKRLNSIETLIGKIENNEFKKEDFLSEITVNVTEMFRDPSFWKELKKLVPSLLQNQNKIKIWHAGCSSGEEVYSMLILLKELNILSKTELTASDIDTHILEKAKQGIIHLRKMDLNSNNYQRYSNNEELLSYFSIVKENAILDKSLLQMVEFKKFDLVNDEFFSKFDIILCRNVLIYFNQNLQREVIKMLSNSLNKNGVLSIGSKESLSWTETIDKFAVINNEEKIYKKIKD